jgi:hypothetical protein
MGKSKKYDIKMIIFLISVVLVIAFVITGFATKWNFFSKESFDSAAVTKVIDDCIDKLSQAAELNASGGNKKSILKYLRDVRIDSKIITGDNFGDELDLTKDTVKSAYLAVKRDKYNRAKLIAKAIKGFETLKTIHEA